MAGAAPAPAISAAEAAVAKQPCGGLAGAAQPCGGVAGAAKPCGGVAGAAPAAEAAQPCGGVHGAHQRQQMPQQLKPQVPASPLAPCWSHLAPGMSTTGQLTCANIP